MERFSIRQVPTGYKFDIKAANGETVATSEVYRTAAACRKGLQSVCVCAKRAAVEDLTAATVQTSHPKFQLYTDRAGAYRFRLTARNGKSIAVSEAYVTRAAAYGGMESLRKNTSME